MSLSETERRLIDCGNALARSIGHVPVQGNAHGCPKVAPSIPCTCGQGAKQAQALNDWLQAVANIEIDAVVEDIP